MEETEVLSLRRVDVLELIEHSPAAAREMVREVSSHVTKMYQRVEELSSGQVEQRVAKLLLRLADGAGMERPGEGTWVPVALSRQELADLCGTTLETAIRVMSALRRRQLVRSSSRGFLIQDRAGLHEALGGRREARRPTHADEAPRPGSARR
jgi:CRP-like cAMP-binding protein